MSWMDVANFDSDGEALAMADYRMVGVNGMGSVEFPEELVTREAAYRRRRAERSLDGLVSNAASTVTSFARQHPIASLALAAFGFHKLGGTKAIKRALRRR